MDTNKSGKGFQAGDRVRFKRPDGVVVEDTVRETFMQTVLLQPYGENLVFPAVVLTEHSWTAVCNLELVRCE